MDISELADQVFDAVRPAIGTYGTGALTTDPREGADPAAERGRSILQEIYWRDKNVPPLETAVDDFAAGPKDDDAASGLHLQLKKVLASDDDLAAEVEKMLRGESRGRNAEADEELARSEAERKG